MLLNRPEPCQEQGLQASILKSRQKTITHLPQLISCPLMLQGMYLTIYEHWLSHSSQKLSALELGNLFSWKSVSSCFHDSQTRNRTPPPQGIHMSFLLPDTAWICWTCIFVKLCWLSGRSTCSCIKIIGLEEGEGPNRLLFPRRCFHGNEFSKKRGSWKLVQVFMILFHSIPLHSTCQPLRCSHTAYCLNVFCSMRFDIQITIQRLRSLLKTENYLEQQRQQSYSWKQECCLGKQASVLVVY